MISCIIQARVSSTRLPGKILKDVSGHPLLWHVINRAKRIKSVDKVVLATTNESNDDTVVDFCKRVEIPCFRGSTNDVLDRYYQTAKSVNADIIVRVTADCPLLDPEISEMVVKDFLEGNCDYSSNAIERTFPDGLDTEVFSFSALERAWKEAKLSSEREHVTSYIWKHPAKFKLRHVKQEKDLSFIRLTVDEPRDLEFVRKIYEHLYRPGNIFSMNDVIGLLGKNPDLLVINQDIQTNEGYLKSLKEDREILSPGE